MWAVEGSDDKYHLVYEVRFSNAAPRAARLDRASVLDVKSGKSITATRDTAIPKSRFCPHAYDIEAVFAPAGYGQEEETFVALIGVYSRGFEGSDRRFIAVPFKPPPLSN